MLIHTMCFWNNLPQVNSANILVWKLNNFEEFDSKKIKRHK